MRPSRRKVKAERERKDRMRVRRGTWEATTTGVMGEGSEGGGWTRRREREERRTRAGERALRVKTGREAEKNVAGDPMVVARKRMSQFLLRTTRV